MNTPSFKIPDEGTPLNPLLSKQTYTYAEKDNQKLKMDIISRPDLSNDAPVILFLFGGGFTHGERDRSVYNFYFNRMAEEGFIIVSIDYRLGLKDNPDVSAQNITPLEKAIDIAREDLFDATSYVLKNATTLHVDTKTIILSGSSAGALVVLSADWHKRNPNKYSTILPREFQYAGVISFSGALFSTTGLPKYEIDPAPTMMFHGTEDHIVFYKGLRLSTYLLLGSSHLADLFTLENYPFYLKRYEGMGHEISKLAMREDLDAIVWFIQNYIINKKNYKIDITFNDLNREKRQLLSVEEHL